MQTKHLTHALLLASFAAPAFTQEVSLGSDTVTATTQSRTPEEVTTSPWWISAEDYDRQLGELGLRTTPEALRYEPGVMVQRTGPAQASPYIRGLTGYHNVMLIDGVRLNNSTFRSGPNQYWNTVDPYSLSHYELVQGPGSVAWGSDAAGGAFQVFTRNPYGYAESGYQGGGRVQLRGSHAEESLTLRTEYSGSYSWDGQSIGVITGITGRTFGDIRGGEDVGEQPNTAYDEYAGDVKIEYWQSDQSRWTFLHQRFRQNNAPRTHRTVHGINWQGLDVEGDLQRDFDQEEGQGVSRTDDMAVVPWGEGAPLLLAVDTVIAQRHFLMSHPLEAVAYKALARNLSDVAAMAARPVGCLLQLTLPPEFTAQQAYDWQHAFEAACEQWNCPLLGGDTSVAPEGGALQLSVTILARAIAEPILRQGAQQGDVLYVSGALGGSLWQPEQGLPHHLNFTPRLELAQALLGVGVHPRAMMDISDGLMHDLPRLAPHALVDLPRLPLSDAAHQQAKLSGKPAWWHGCADGEDYELLMAFDPSVKVPAEVAGVPLTKIGRATQLGGVRWQVSADMDVDLECYGKGWQHEGQ